MGPTDLELSPAEFPPRMTHVDDFLSRLGDIPISRVLFNPGPQSVVEADLLEVNGTGERLCELVDGTLVENPLGFEKSLIALAIARAIGNFVAGKRLGLVTGPDGMLRMAKGNVRLPDVSFVAAGSLPGGKRPRGPVPQLQPTIAVDVFGPGNTASEMREKRGEYFESGARLVWVVYPASKTVAVFDGPTDEPREILSGTDRLDGGHVLPEFAMPLADVFRVSEFD